MTGLRKHEDGRRRCAGEYDVLPTKTEVSRAWPVRVAAEGGGSASIASPVCHWRCPAGLGEESTGRKLCADEPTARCELSGSEMRLRRFTYLGRNRCVVDREPDNRRGQTAKTDC